MGENESLVWISAGEWDCRQREGSPICLKLEQKNIFNCNEYSTDVHFERQASGVHVGSATSAAVEYAELRD